MKITMKSSLSILKINTFKSSSLVIALIVLVKAVCSSATSPSTVNSTEAQLRLNEGTTALAFEFVQQIVSSNPDKNSVSSAASVLIPLAQLALWATGTALEQLLNVLHLKSKDEIKTVFSELTKRCKSQENVKFEVATKYYANVGFPLSKNFIADSKEYFDAGGENLDFSQKEAAAKTINDWVANRTHDKIQDLVSPDMLSGAIRLLLVNAIYFNGNWINKFNGEATENKDFYKANGETVSVQMMYQQSSFDYTESDKYKALRMYYEGYKFSLIVILPREKTGLLDTVKAFQNLNEFDNMIKSLHSEEVQVHLPKFIIETQLDMIEMLKKVNVTDIFNPNINAFEGILEINEPLFVSKAVQKAYISVDENGTEAAAATMISIMAGMSPGNKIYEFNANHPYLYFILHGDEALFGGSFVKPQ